MAILFCSFDVVIMTRTFIATCHTKVRAKVGAMAPEVAVAFAQLGLDQSNWAVSTSAWFLNFVNNPELASRLIGTLH